MRGHNIYLNGKFRKIILNYPCYRFLSVVLKFYMLFRALKVGSSRFEGIIIFSNSFPKLSESSFYKEIGKFQ